MIRFIDYTINYPVGPPRATRRALHRMMKWDDGLTISRGVWSLVAAYSEAEMSPTQEDATSQPRRAYVSCMAKE